MRRWPRWERRTRWPSAWRTPFAGGRGLVDALAGAGLAPLPSQANFVYAETADGDGDRLADLLLREGFAVRALRGFGAAGAIRVTCGTEEENAGFSAALARVAR